MIKIFNLNKFKKDSKLDKIVKKNMLNELNQIKIINKNKYMICNISPQPIQYLDKEAEIEFKEYLNQNNITKYDDILNHKYSFLSFVLDLDNEQSIKGQLDLIFNPVKYELDNINKGSYGYSSILFKTIKVKIFIILTFWLKIKYYYSIIN